MSTVAVQPPTSAWLKRFSHGLFLGLPDPTNPGILAFCVVIARATLGGLIIAIPAALYWGPESAIGGLPRLCVTLGWVVFEELARLNFAYRAARPARSLLLFLALIITVETLFYPTGGHGLGVFLLARAPSMGLHVVATAGVALGLRNRRWLLPLFLVVTALHVAFDFWAPEIVGALTGLNSNP